MDIPLPTPTESDIYSYGFDKNLNRTILTKSVDGQFSSSFSDIPLIIETSTSTGLKNIFSIVSSGDNIGDVKIGDYDGNQGILYDRSANNTIFKGTITASAGSIGGWVVSAAALYYDGATDALSAGMASADYPFYAGKKYADRATAPFRVTPAGALVASSATITGALTAAAGSVIATSYLSGLVAQSNLNIANQGWTQTCAFSSTDLDTVSWGAGTLTTAGGTTYNIGAGNTGNMAARTYIYLDIAVSTTAYQTTTTAATAAVGAGKIMVATAINGAVEATFEVFGGVGGLKVLATDALVANSVTAGQLTTGAFVTTTANITDGIITNAKISDLAVSKLTAGSITSKAITLAIADGTGDAKIQAGKTDFGDDATGGFILGLDDSDSNKAKFEIGSSATKLLKYDGIDLTLIGGTITGGTIQTAAANQRIALTSTGLAGYNSSDVQELWLNASASESANGLVLKSATDQTLAHIENTNTGALTKETLIAVNRGTGKPAAFFKTYNTGATGDTVQIIQSGTGNGLYVNLSLSTNAAYAGDFRNAGTSGGALYCFTGANSTDAVAKFEQTATVSTNFKRILNLDGMIIFKSDGTSPNGVLSGAAGNICINADAGKAYYCTGTTNWTAF